MINFKPTTKYWNNTVEQQTTHTKDEKNEKGEQENSTMFQQRPEEHLNTPSGIKNQQLENHPKQ